MTGPAVITCDLRLNVPKIAPLAMMMKAKKAPIEQHELSGLNIGSSKIKVGDSTEPAKKKGGVKVKDVDQLL